MNRRERPRLGPSGLLVLLGCGCGFVDGEPLLSGPLSASSDASKGGPTSSTSTAPATDGPADSTATTAAPSTTDTSTNDGTGSTPACACEPHDAAQRCVRLVNTCDETIDTGLTGDETAGPLDVSTTLQPGECTAVVVTELIGGRAFARRGCVGDTCDSDGNEGRGTLVQFSLQSATDVYDVSLVGGFDLPMAMMPVGVDEPPEGDRCQPAQCAADLNAVCPEGLRRDGAGGGIAYCTTPCDACTACPACLDCGNLADPSCDPCSTLADVCCTAQACEPNAITTLWKSLCPDAITDPSDGTAFVCDQAPDYDVVFCP